ncbi:hypothetical protein [Streptacidiphilus sp. MAP12-20]|uniref:hypothetical protein n=1 Tax=Streptacidiphilus sp. MAP12-20 TaxID=3156299 RepID=UPI003518CE93
MDTIEFRLSQRRVLLIWTAACTLSGTVGLAAVLLRWGGPTPLLVSGFLVAPMTLNISSGHTRLDAKGLTTGTLLTRRHQPWSRITGFETRTTTYRGSDTFIYAMLSNGKRVKLSAPLDSTNGHDPEFAAKLERIRRHWAAATGPVF